jgi:hypothetical protein
MDEVVAKAREVVAVARITTPIKVKSLARSVTNLIMMQLAVGIGLILKL